jgi:hypothetical protein
MQDLVRKTDDQVLTPASKTVPPTGNRSSANEIAASDDPGKPNARAVLSPRIESCRISNSYEAQTSELACALHLYSVLR